MAAPSALPAPRSNLSEAGMRSRAAATVAADIIYAVGDYTGGAHDDLFTMTAHGLSDGDVLFALWQSAMGAILGGEGTRGVVTVYTSSTFTLTTNGTTGIENTADGDVLFYKSPSRGAANLVASSVIPNLIVAAGDENGGATDDVFVPAQGTKGLVEADTMKLLYKAAAGVLTGIAANTTVYAKAPTVTYFQVAATSGGAAIVNTTDGIAVFLKTS